MKAPVKPQTELETIELNNYNREYREKKPIKQKQKRISSDSS